MLRNPRAVALTAALLMLLAAVGSSPAGDADVPPSVRTARDRVFPSVVRIDVHTQTFAEGEEEIVRGTGSGFVINGEGHILTNYHVAGRAQRLIVTLVNKERVHARLIFADHWTDLAVIQVEPQQLLRQRAAVTAAPLGDSSMVVIGEPVLAMGTPYGLSRTMTQGIITNNERYFSGETIDGYETGDFNNWLQTDAAINPGNSGGPLVNLRGEVIGVNTRGAEMAEGLGFAVPINVAKEVVGRILETGKVERSYVGLRFRELQDLETHFGLTANKGVLIESVDPRSPAEQAGLRAEDVLLRIDSTEVSARFPEELPEIRKRIAETPIGGSIRVQVKRGETQQEFDVTTTRLESEIADDEREYVAWGLTLRSVTRMYAAMEKLPDSNGVLITGVKNASPAERAGLEVGDIIRAVERQAVTDLAAFDALYRRTRERRDARILVEVLRGVAVQIVVLKPLDTE